MAIDTLDMPVFTTENPSGRDDKLDVYFGDAALKGVKPSNMHLISAPERKAAETQVGIEEANS